MRTPLNSIHFYQNVLLNSPVSKKDLETIFKKPFINEAIYLEAPALHLELEQWFIGFIEEPNKITDLQNAFLKQLTRLSSSCTPSGLFAASCIGSFSTHTHIELQSTEHFKRSTRLDRTYIVTLVSMLLKNDLLKSQLSYYPNKKLYTIRQQNRIFDEPVNNKKPVYMLAGAIQSSYITPIIKAAKQGKTIKELSHQLMDSNISRVDANIFINELIHQKVLVSELEHKLSNQNALQDLIDILSPKKNTEYITQKLKNFQDELYTIDFNLNNTANIYKRLLEELNQLGPSVHTNYIFKTNLFSTTKNNTLEYKIADELIQAMPILNKLTLANQNNSLSHFVKRFVARYKNTEVPLTLVLDTNSGIGYNPEKTEQDNLELKRANKCIKNIKWTAIDDILLEKLVHALNSPKQNIVLTDSDFKGFTANWNDLPDTLSARIQIVGEKDNRKTIINTVESTFNANLLGVNRTQNKTLKTHIATITCVEKQSNPSTQLAEIVCPIRLQTGTAIQTKKRIKTQSNGLEQSNTNPSLKITFTDLMISVKNGSIYLRSKLKNKYIEPQFTQVDNYPNENLPIYRFFKDLQTQHTRSNISHKWNPIFKQQPFLPRVEYKNFILSKARWQIKTHTIVNFFKKRICLKSITKWRETIMLPQYVELIENNNKLLIDFENLSALQMLYTSIKNKPSFVLEESLITEEQIVKEKGQSFNNEIIVSMHK